MRRPRAFIEPSWEISTSRRPDLLRVHVHVPGEEREQARNELWVTDFDTHVRRRRLTAILAQGGAGTSPPEVPPRVSWLQAYCFTSPSQTR